MGAGAGQSAAAPLVAPKPPPLPPAALLCATDAGDTPLLLTADVGGTNTRLHLFQVPEGLGDRPVPADHIVLKAKYCNDRYESFTDVLRDFLGKANVGRAPYIACFAVAGVVADNTCNLVNLGWRLEGHQIAREMGIHRVQLINDFEAQGYGVLTVDPGTECDILQGAPILEGAPKAVIGAGTGLGEAFLTTGLNGDYEVWPAEGGHREFAPRQDGMSKLQFEMCQYLQIKYSAKSRISVERIVSGRGIANIYQFLAWRFPEKVNHEVHRHFLGPIEGPAKNDPAAIVEAARAEDCDICQQAVELFVSAYGAEAGVMALKYMPFGGLYVTGGVSWKLRDFIVGRGPREHGFMDAFLDKGRVTPMLMRIPVYLVHGEEMGERGVMLKAVRLYAEARDERPSAAGHM